MHGLMCLMAVLMNLMYAYIGFGCSRGANGLILSDGTGLESFSMMSSSESELNKHIKQCFKPWKNSCIKRIKPCIKHTKSAHQIHQTVQKHMKNTHQLHQANQKSIYSCIKHAHQLHQTMLQTHQNTHKMHRTHENNQVRTYHCCCRNHCHLKKNLGCRKIGLKDFQCFVVHLQHFDALDCCFDVCFGVL